MGVEEQRVGTPRERLGPPVQVVVCRSLGELATVLVLHVLGVSRVLDFGVVDPGSAHGDCDMELESVKYALCDVTYWQEERRRS